MEELNMAANQTGGGRGFPVIVGLVILAVGCLGAATAFANNGVNTPAVGGYTADMVRAAAQQQVYDPPLDVFGSGASCPDPVNYGFDYGDSVYVWLNPGGDMFFAIETHGNIGDSDQDGGYNTENTTCGGHPACVNTEADAFDNVFASGVESVTISIDRDCNGTSDLRFTLTGAGNMTADSVSVTLDALTGFFGDILGGQGTAWGGAPLQPGPDAVCVADRNGVVVIKIADWNRYFQDATPPHDFLPGVSPTTFDWIVDSGNNSDFYTEDLVTGRFDISNPQIDLQKSVSRSEICASGDTTRFTLTVTNTGNTPLTNVTLTDQLPAGLVYDNAYIDDPSDPIGSPSVVSNNLSWNTFSLNPGDSRTVSYRAVSDGCQGQVANNAVVLAEFDIDCLGGPVGVGDQDSANVTCVEPCVTVSAPGPQSLCAGSPWSATFVVTNCATVVEDLSIVLTVGGVAQPAVVRNAVAVGDTVHVEASGTLPATCGPPIAVSCEATATLPGVPPEGCSDVDSDATTISCTAACVTVADAPPDSTCPGTDLWLEFVVTNCNGQGGAENMTFSGMYNGSTATVSPTSATNVADGDTVHVKLLATLPAEDCSPNGYLGTVTATAALVTDAECQDTDSGDGLAFCTDPNVEIVKTTSPTTTTSGSTVTLEISNPSDVTLDPVQVSDHLPPGMLFDDTQTIGGTCGTSVDHVQDLGGTVWVYFTDFVLGPGESCTITYDVDCGEFDGQARIDTAYVDAWCEGTYDFVNPVSDSDTAVVVCEGGQACPRTIGFWRQQCAQKGNGSTKVCEAGMESLWVCVINATDVVQWKLNEGGYETTAYLRTLSPSDLFDHLCTQLQGPRPMTLLNMTEIQYLGLMLNYCSEALSSGIPVQNSFSGTVGAAIDSIEAAINSGMNLGYWEKVADEINNNIGVLAAACDNEDTFFQTLPGCVVDAPSIGQPDVLGAFDPNVLIARAAPNPVTPGSAAIIYYQIPAAAGRTSVELNIYDIAGRLVRTLVSEGRNPGTYQADWNLTNESGLQVPSGVYFYRLRAGSQVFTQKMLVVRH
jgi:uncharacterized repeat protein (TIGR01451 family)